MARTNPSLEGQVAIITGAGRGLGRAYALRLASQGAAVVVNNRVHEGLPSAARQVADEITAMGGRAIADEHSVVDEQGMAEMVANAIRTFGSADILVCNAGIAKGMEFHDTTIAEIREMIDIHVMGTLLPLHNAWKEMLKRRYGRVILTSSSAGIYGLAGCSIYGAAKSAMLGLMRGLSCEIPKDSDIKVNMILPAAYTGMSAGAVVAHHHQELLSPHHVAKVVGWLASKECRDTGTIMRIGAGKAARIRTMQNEPVSIGADDDVGVCLASIPTNAGLKEYTDIVSAAKAVTPELY